MATPDYYPGEDFDFELQDQTSESLDIPYETFIRQQLLGSYLALKQLFLFPQILQKTKGKEKVKL